MSVEILIEECVFYVFFCHIFIKTIGNPMEGFENSRRIRHINPEAVGD